jgi:hypothetical protein
MARGRRPKPWEVPDALWDRVAPLLPPATIPLSGSAAVGRPPSVAGDPIHPDHRDAVGAPAPRVGVRIRHDVLAPSHQEAVRSDRHADPAPASVTSQPTRGALLSPSKVGTGDLNFTAGTSARRFVVKQGCYPTKHSFGGREDVVVCSRPNRVVDVDDVWLRAIKERHRPF